MQIFGFLSRRIRSCLLCGLAGCLQAGFVSADPPLLPDTLAFPDSVMLAESERASAVALGQARRALDQGDLSAAASLLAEAGGLTLLLDHLDCERVRLLSAQGRFSQAASLAAATADRFPHSPIVSDLFALRAEALVAEGGETAAREAWALALENSTDLERRRAFRIAIVESHQRTGDLDSSTDPEQLFGQVKGLEPHASELPPTERSAVQELEFAKEATSRGLNEEAVAAYDRALARGLPPDFERPARWQLGQLLFNLREYDRAIEIFRSLAPDPEAVLFWGRSLARTGQVDRGIEKLERVAESGPPELAHRAAYLAGTLLEDQQERARALAHYARTAKKSNSPQQAIAALWRMGWMAWQQGRYVEARVYFDEMIDRASSALAALRPRYWSARAALRIDEESASREGQAELVALATDWPLSYYGWRAQQRLGGVSPRAKADVGPVLNSEEEQIEPKLLRRIALLTLAGFDESARAELADAAQQAASLNDRIQVGRLAAALDDYHTGQRLLVEAHPDLLGQGLRQGLTPLFWLAWPPAYRELVLGSGSREGSPDAELVWAIMREESSFRPKVISSAGAMGLLQLMPSTAEDTAVRAGLPPPVGSESLLVPAINIELGSAYLAHLSERFPSRMSAVIASYNAGPRAVERWLSGDAAEREDDEWVEEIPYSQTRAYAKRVLRSLHAYRSFYR